ncbi:hypothetical protein [Arthrobacter koreensis]|uniref:hypothetical protein n=1 Tax=Arthrobacter koreensis TaxID=199136 RepID=UPI002DB61B5F|nr:hypothetical protein [Arthrobacter koreensis]MEB7505468.1 hypothetical protein [Arthrobacter koreensis]
MRTKALAAAGIAGLMLSGCSPAEPAPKAEPRPPANERNLGSFSGSVNSGTEAGFGAHGEVVAAYLSCASEGELRIGVLDLKPVTVICGTWEEPTRTVFEGLTAGAKLSSTIEPVDEPVVVELVFTDAMS